VELENEDEVSYEWGADSILSVMIVYQPLDFLKKLQKMEARLMLRALRLV
jgi:hypothetical protein